MRESSARSSISLRRWTTTAAAAAAVVFCVAAGWAFARVTSPPEGLKSGAEAVLATARIDEVGDDLALNVSARWPGEFRILGGLEGTVTAVMVIDGQPVNSGEVLFSVDLQPVVVVEGAVPTFRAMGPGTAGPDVAQLQTFLRIIGFYDGAVDGDFGGATHDAVRSWQLSIGAQDDGVVELGEVLFVSGLPRPIDVEEATVRVGELLPAGGAVGSVLAASPEFTLTVSASQSAAIKDNAEVRFEDREWLGSVGSRSSDDEGNVVIRITPREGGSICGDQCASITRIGATSFAARVTVRAPVRGVTVPTAALLSGPDGSTVVVDATGTRRDVTVVASAGGRSVVEGIAAGIEIRVQGTGDD